MRSLIFAGLLLCIGCGVAPQPESNRTVAAYEVPLPTASDKRDFLEILSREAEAHGFHVDAATAEEMRVLSEVSPITFNASVWRGDDEESVASAMDFRTHLGRVWIAFSLGTEPVRFEQFRKALMPQVEQRWPETALLPIMPSGAIPLDEDLVRTPSGYEAKPAEKHKYEAIPD